MTNPFARFDGVVLGLHQRIADAVQYRTDRNCFWLARVSLLAFAVANTGMAFYLLVILPRAALRWTVVGLLTMVIYVFAGFLLSVVERISHPRMKSWLEPYWWSRICAVLFIGTLIADDLARGTLGVTDTLMIPLVVAFYFASCTRLPPGSKKPEKERIAQLRFAPT